MTPDIERLCESEYCLADKDYRNAFDITEDGLTITIYLKELMKHTHAMKFLFEDKVFIMGQKDGILQIWREDSE